MRQTKAPSREKAIEIISKLTAEQCAAAMEALKPLAEKQPKTDN